MPPSPLLRPRVCRGIALTLAFGLLLWNGLSTTFAQPVPREVIASFDGFDVMPSPGKGLGCFATKNFKAGDLVYEEEPILIFESNMALKQQLAEGSEPALIFTLAVVLAVVLVGAVLGAVTGDIKVTPFSVLAFLVASFGGIGGLVLKWYEGGRERMKQEDEMFASGPLFVPPELQPQWLKLTTEQRQSIADLADSTVGETTINGIFKTNSFSKGSSIGTESSVLCTTLARFNHSCNPTCRQSWNEEDGRERMYAFTDIKPGDEMYTGYIDILKSRRLRRDELLSKYLFSCECPACCIPDIDASDVRRQEIARLDSKVRNSGKDPQTGLKLVEELLQVIDEEGIHDRYLRARVCDEAFQLSLLAKDLDAAKDWAGKAHVCYSQARGANSPEAQELKEFAEHPEKHPNWA